jgi:hypothetical protein
MPAKLVLDGLPRAISPGRTECRVTERLACALPSSCQPTSAYGSKESRWKATIRDISLGGANLYLSRRFEPGTGLAIEIPGSEGRDSYTVLARVVHVRSLGDGTWSLGCKFASDLGEEEVQRLMPTKVVEKPDSRKVLNNVDCHLEIRPGTILSYRIKRLNVSSDWPLPAGKIFTLRGKGANGKWALKIKIEESLEQEGSWAFAGRLQSPPSAENLLVVLSELGQR